MEDAQGDVRVWLARQVKQLRERVDSGENHTESENDSTQCQSDECGRTSETSRVHVQKGQMG